MRALILAIVMLSAAVAAAQAPTRTDLDKAKAHYKAGEAFFAAGVFDRAIAEYEAAYALTMRAPLLYNLGSAYRRKGEETGTLEDKKGALEFYEKYVAAEPNGKGSVEARRWIEVLKPEVEKLEAEEAARPHAPPPTASATPPAAVDAAPSTAPVVDQPRKSKKTVRIVGYATAGAGAVLLGTGIFFGLKAKSAADDLDAIEAGGNWDQGLYDSGKSYERNAFILGGVGAAAIAGGLVTAFVFGRESQAPTVAITPRGTLVVAGQF